MKIGGRIVASVARAKPCSSWCATPRPTIQLFCRINDMSEADWELLRNFDLGDIVNVEGVVVRTKRGELSIAPRAPYVAFQSCASASREVPRPL